MTIVWMLLALCALALFGYLAACAGAGRWINFVDWLMLRRPR